LSTEGNNCFYNPLSQINWYSIADLLKYGYRRSTKNPLIQNLLYTHIPWHSNGYPESYGIL